MKKTLLITILVVLCLLPLGAHAVFKFDTGDIIKNSLPLSDKDAKTTVMDFVRYGLSLVGLIAVVMIIYGGIRYMTSRGNPDAIKNAREILKWSIIGLIVIIFSQVIINNLDQFVRKN
ncbi:MAG: hypothetical protein COT25_01170 [Candidatus Kerfeldbacteria bacterium CG08_land_8_20_14_0_20_42_7]|uniref:DUF4134 domain-containing protein n=1 Tax=Candidatus Kerfeldbacteria bacterium CG08_land_8_20_14_0_20_42_7 TaxID=2014245 RepID=A0A2H0YU34_9BACT|nr:MAG: hypothetical protein COT25_01170 [Candidatus Kerfeldbacteria bacterium CG08_land_8_20_14_0_20_42_7]